MLRQKYGSSIAGLLAMAACGLGTEPRENPTDWSPAQGWRTFQGGPEHTGHVPVVVDASRFREAWTFDLAWVGFQTFGLQPPVAAEGLVAVSGGRDDPKVGVFDAETGALLWSRNFVEVDGPALYDGKLYVLGDGSIYSMNARTGAVHWSRPLNTPSIEYRAPVLAGSRLIVGGLQVVQGGQEWLGAGGWDPDFGVEWWHAAFAEEGNWSATVAEGVAYVFSGSRDSRTVRALDVWGGDSLFSIPDPGYGSFNATSTLVWTGDRYLATGQGNRLVAFDTQTRTVAWEAYRPGSLREPTIIDSVLYASSTAGLVAHRVRDGAPLWTQSRVSLAITPLVSTRNLVFVSTASETIAIDVRSRGSVWRYPLSGYLAISDGGLLIIAGRNGRVAAIDLG